jgi:hypothetical protein
MLSNFFSHCPPKKKKKNQFSKENSKNSKLIFLQKLVHTLDTILLESPNEWDFLEII